MRRLVRLVGMGSVLLLSATSLPEGAASTETTGQAAGDVSKSNVARVGGAQASSGGHIVFEGNRLYMGTYGAGFRIFDISDPVKPTLIGRYEPGTPRADAVPDAVVFGGQQFAVLNGSRRLQHRPPLPTELLATDRSEFLDVTNPANPVLLHTFIGQPDGEAHNGDIYDAKRLWLPSGGTADNGLRIYNLQPLLDNPPDLPGTTCDDGVGAGCNANDPVRLFPSGPCRTDPNIRCDPVTLWETSPYRQGRPVGEPFQHTHDVTLYPNHPVRQPNGTVQSRDIILLAEGGAYTRDNANNGSVFVIDITDPSNPVVLYRWLHETGPGHHPIRYHHEAQLLDGDPSVMLVTDEDLHHGCGGNGGVVAVRIDATLTSGVELSEWFIPRGTPAAVCSAHVFSTENNLMFMGSYNAGLQVVDYSNPAKPQQVGHFIAEGTTAWGAYFNPVNGYIYQGDMSRGLDIFQYLGPGAARPGRQYCPGFRNSDLPQTIGTDRPDVLKGRRGRDVICGGKGKDRIQGVGGNDVLIGEQGSDRLQGGKGRDRLRGNGGKDRLGGGRHVDRCNGGPGRDRLKSCERGKR
jgi:hypothetical protein